MFLWKIIVPCWSFNIFPTLEKSLGWLLLNKGNSNYLVMHLDILRINPLNHGKIGGYVVPVRDCVIAKEVRLLFYRLLL